MEGSGQELCGASRPITGGTEIIEGWVVKAQSTRRRSYRLTTMATKEGRPGIVAQASFELSLGRIGRSVSEDLCARQHRGDAHTRTIQQMASNGSAFLSAAPTGSSIGVAVVSVGRAVRSLQVPGVCTRRVRA